MKSEEKKIFIGVILLVLVAWLISPLTGSSYKPLLSTPQFLPSFDASRAFQATEEFVTQFPERILGSVESRQSTGYLREYLERLGYQIEYSHFDATIDGRKQVGRNLLAFKQGQTNQIVALIAHYDTAPTTVQGAMKNGSGVGVLLEIARIFAESRIQHSMLFMLSDGAEWGALGALDLAHTYPERDRIIAVLSLDYVSIGDLAAFSLAETGQLGGFTPPWLRQITHEAAEAGGLAVVSPSGFQEHLERALLISWNDQGPFLSAGIPAINLGSVSTERSYEKTVFHSPQDTIDNLRVSAFETFGLAAERIMRELDNLTSIPVESSELFRLRDSTYLTPKVITGLHYITFIPILVVFYFHYRNCRDCVTSLQIGRELLVYLSTILPFLTVYFGIQVFRFFRLLPLYDLYPASAKDPVIENPSWGVLTSLFGIGLIVAVICYFSVRFLCRSMPRPDFLVSKLVLLGILVIIIAFALQYNSYWAITFLVLPAYVWAVVGLGLRFGKRMVNWIWIVAAGIPYPMLLCFYTARLEPTWKLIWYEILALSTGLFTGVAYLLAAGMVAAGIRLLAIQSGSSRD